MKEEEEEGKRRNLLKEVIGAEELLGFPYICTARCERERTGTTSRGLSGTEHEGQGQGLRGQVFKGGRNLKGVFLAAKLRLGVFPATLQSHSLPLPLPSSTATPVQPETILAFVQSSFGSPDASQCASALRCSSGSCL